MNDITKTLLISGSLLAMLAVILGAFGAHGLKKVLTEEMLTVFKTAVDYHFIHALGIILIGILYHQFPQSHLLLWAAIAMIVGIVIFSGSLYTLSITDIKRLGMITPIGGLAFILGWILLALGIYKA